MIAHDTSTFGGANTSSFSHACSGSDRVLFVGGYGDTVDSVTGITYNGVAMTLIGKAQVSGDRWVYLFGLLNPASGSNTVAVSGAAVNDWIASSYTGVKQSDLPDSSNTGTQSSSTSFELSTTTVVDNCWTVMIAKAGGGDNPTAGTGATERQSELNVILADSNGAITPAGSYSMTVNCTSSQNWAGVIASIAPAAAAGGTTRRYTLTTLGVG